MWPLPQRKQEDVFLRCILMLHFIVMACSPAYTMDKNTKIDLVTFKDLPVQQLCGFAMLLV